MAFTIKYFPPDYSSFQDDLIYTVAYPEHVSDSTTYPNYKFIADVYVNSVMVARIKKVQDPITGIGIFNIGQVVRNYVNATFNPTGSILMAQLMGSGQFSLNVQIKFGEEYAYTSYINLLVDSVRPFFNNYNGRQYGINSSLQTVINGIASNRPRVAHLLMSNQFYLVPYFAFSGGSPVFTVTPVGGGIPYSGTFSPTALSMAMLNVSPMAINAVQPGTITAATQYYTVNINGGLLTVNIICEAMYRPYAIHFFNQYGGFETKLFTKVSQTSFDITRKDFGKLPYLVDAAGIPTHYNANNVYNESRSTYSVQYVEKMTINSDLLTDAEYIWLKELLVSPMVYLEDNGYFFPVVITNNDYDVKKYINEDSLNNLTLSIEFGTQLNAQYR